MSKILLVTDAWEPQVNGVVTTLKSLVKEAQHNQDEIQIFHPELVKYSFPLPTYPEIKISIISVKQAKQIILESKCNHIHIATAEGPLGMQFARACADLNIDFSTSCHTKFPEFIHARYSWFPLWLGWSWMRHMYKNSKVVLTTTPSMVKELQHHNFKQEICSWTRGIDREIFYPEGRKDIYCGRPILLNVGRVSQEKGLDDFCELELGSRVTKVIVGDGPYRKELEKRYPDIIFTGMLKGKELADWYRTADVFVFTSRSDTFGVVMLESIACGTPVAAYPVTGPIDVIEEGKTGSLDNDITVAIKNCIDISRDSVYNNSLKYSWHECYNQFKNILLPI